MSLNRSFWKDRRVFLTGHTGFKGSWLSLWLSTLGARVVGYALDPPTSVESHRDNQLPFKAGLCPVRKTP